MNPQTGRWEVVDADGVVLDFKTTWQCGYCDWKSLCSQTEPGRIDVAPVRKMANEMIKPSVPEPVKIDAGDGESSVDVLI